MRRSPAVDGGGAWRRRLTTWALGLAVAAGGAVAASAGPCSPGWSVIPQLREYGSLFGVTAAGPNDVWAVGSLYDANEHGVAWHWDGATWGEVPLQIESGAYDSRLEDAEAISTTDAWLVGRYGELDTLIRRPLLLHWDGSTFAQSFVVGGDGPILRGVAAAASGDVWAVGSSDGGPLAFHFDGNDWTSVDTNQPVGERWGLNDVAVVGPGDVWAVGSARKGRAKVTPDPALGGSYMATRPGTGGSSRRQGPARH